MNESRTHFTVKNAIFGYIGSALSLVLGFVSRYLFVRNLDIAYLGVSGLFANVLGVLSFAELGFGTAINFGLYKPVAQKDSKKIKSLMQLYKKVYLSISIIVLTIGICVTPFLEMIINDPGNVGSLRDIRIYYLIFLLNTVLSYVVSYKYSLANAEQRTYIQTNIETITTLLTTVIQICSIIIFHSYMVYLVSGLVVNLLVKICTNYYLNKRYPILIEKGKEKIDEEEMSRIKKNVKGLIFHRFGEVSVYQTDNIIISAFISLEIVGKISNYTMIIDGISKFTNATFNSFIASLGNLIATEDEKKQYRIFCEYKFIGFWIYGFCSIMLYIFLSPFLEWVFGGNFLIDEFSVTLICLDFYLRGQRICINNIKTAGGVFYQDRYVAFLQAILNLVLSIVFANWIGLAGVYLGTVLQGAVANIIKPYYVYRDMFHMKVNAYYKLSTSYFLMYILTALICRAVKGYLLVQSTLLSLMIIGVLCIILINVFFLLFGFRREEFRSVIRKVKYKLT